MKNKIMNEPIVNSIIGKDIESAKKVLEENGYTMRVVGENGTPFMVTQEYLPKRVNVFTKNGFIFDLNGIG